MVVLGPWLLTGWHPEPPLFGWRATRWLGGVLIVLALPVFAAFTLRFVAEGHGTPAPIAPTERLVVGGRFRWVRNPGYDAARRHASSTDSEVTMADLAVARLKPMVSGQLRSLR